MMKKTLIVHGSPRLSGDSAYLINELKKHLKGEVVEISAYRSKIAPCLDCRKCQETGSCILNDEMNTIFADDYDNVVLATPVYYGTLPGPMFSLLSRFQLFRAPKNTIKMKKKKGALILTAGGSTSNDHRVFPHVNIFFKMINASGFEDHTVKSVHTDTIPAYEDKEAVEAIKELADWLKRVD